MGAIISYLEVFDVRMAEQRPGKVHCLVQASEYVENRAFTVHVGLLDPNHKSVVEKSCIKLNFMHATKWIDPAASGGQHVEPFADARGLVHLAASQKLQGFGSYFGQHF